MIASPFPQKPRVAALIVAGGRGARAATADDASPKQYRMLGGVPVIARTIAVFDGHPSVDAVVAVIHADDDAPFYTATQDRARADAVVIGGASRQDSVLRGLEHLAKARQRPDIVLIHDAVRPFLDPAVIDRLIAALHDHAGAIAALPAVDTLKAERPDGTIARTVPRAGLWAAQTPQAFVFSTILDAHLAARDMGLSDFTDDAAVAEWRGIDVALVAGNAENVKLTTAADIAIADEHLSRENLMALADIRTGTGFDVHAFSEGRSVTLCGVEIAHDHTLHGHSDADVAMHALTDALFGALAAGDIGSHFPPSARRDLRYRDRPRFGQGNDDGTARLHRTARGHRSDGLGDRAPAGRSLIQIKGTRMIDEALRQQAEQVLEICRGKGLTVATAESCTGGLIIGTLTEIAGSSDVVDRGFVTYSNAAKSEVLRVAAETIVGHGAVSEAVARAMAAGALAKSRADITVAVTGVAGPGGGTAEKPVGLVHLAAAARKAETLHLERRYGAKSRSEIRAATVADALGLIAEIAALIPTD